MLRLSIRRLVLLSLFGGFDGFVGERRERISKGEIQDALNDWADEDVRIAQKEHEQAVAATQLDAENSDVDVREMIDLSAPTGQDGNTADSSVSSDSGDRS